MIATIDAGGRVVVPKAIRDRLALRPGSEVDIHESDGVVTIEPTAAPAGLIEEQGLLVIEPTGAILTADDVRALRDAGRR